MRKLGLYFIVASLLIFITSLFLNDYQIKKENLQKLIGVEGVQVDLVMEHTELFDEYSSKPELIKVINIVFEDVNQSILEKEGVTEEEIKGLSSALSEGYDEEKIRQFFGEEGSEKANKIISFTSWIKDEGTSNWDEVWSKMEPKIKEVNTSIIASFGFPSDKLKGFQFSLVKSASKGIVADMHWLFFALTFLLGGLGAVIYFAPSLINAPGGIKNDGVFHNKATNRGWVAILVFGALVSFYIFLYWFPSYLVEWVLLVEPFARLFNPAGEASHWFLYGFMYCFIMTVMGFRVMLKYKNNKYQILRTATVWFFQVVFAFTLPEILASLNGGWAWVDLKNMWPLDYDFFNNGGLINYAKIENEEFIPMVVNGGKMGMAFLIWGIILFTIGVPILVYFFGKRWYCSWVCGCGGLAETLGDPYRQLSDKSLKSWKIERWLIYSVLVFATLMTIISIYTMFTGQWSFMGIPTGDIQKVYSFLIGSVFAGVIGTGFYPVMGNRVWCRFGCPLSAWLGIVQRFKSRFRITTNGAQCISCGNCSTYCEMGIDVKWYAQRGQDIVRSSCVGCGVCSAVCPRGVLKLENAPEDTKKMDLWSLPKSEL